MKKSYKVITSLSNPIIRETVRIKKRIDRRHNSFLIEGPHLIESAVFSSSAYIKRIFFIETFMATEKFNKLSSLLPDTEKFLVTPKILSLLTDTETPQGVSALVSYKFMRLEELEIKNDFLLLLCDAIQDPGNLGTIIRASAAFNVSAVVILPFTCNPFNPKSLRATAGGIFLIPIIYASYEQILDFLNNKDIPLFIATTEAKRPIYEINFRQPLAIIFGNEARGVTEIFQNIARDAFKIPIDEKIESLNVSMATSICLYEISRQRYSLKT